jgi:cell wall-associated NlpC family hydrolase
MNTAVLARAATVGAGGENGVLFVQRPARVLSAAITCLVTFALTALLSVAATNAPADAAARYQNYGLITQAYQGPHGWVSVQGFAFDRAHPYTGRVCLVIRGNCVKVVHPNQPSPRFDAYHHVAGPHHFQAWIRTRYLVLGMRSAGGAPLDAVWINTPGSRIVHVARQFVGGRYSYGGASPRTGFDCSGLAMYSYAHARVASLPHSAQAQRYHTHWIHSAQARPGDLVFYLSGNYAYHVAIYAGRGYQYSAADPADGIRFQRIWARNIEFRTDWH